MIIPYLNSFYACDQCFPNHVSFVAGSSVSESATGAKEVVIQGDVMFELPALLMSEFKVECLHTHILLLSF